MVKVTRAIFLFFCIVSLYDGTAAAEAPPPPGIAVVDSLMPDSVSLQGHVVYVDFWASWCAPCRKSLPWLDRLQERYAGDGLTIVGINVDRDRKAADKFMTQADAAMQIVYDPKGNVARQYHLVGMPSSYIYGRDGTFRRQELGFGDADTLQIETYIKSLLKEDHPE